MTNMDAFRAAGIPYARNHDAAFCATYGGELIREEIFTAEEFSAYVKMPLNSTYLFKIEKL